MGNRRGGGGVRVKQRVEGRVGWSEGEERRAAAPAAATAATAAAVRDGGLVVPHAALAADAIEVVPADASGVNTAPGFPQHTLYSRETPAWRSGTALGTQLGGLTRGRNDGRVGGGGRGERRWMRQGELRRKRNIEGTRKREGEGQQDGT